MTCTAVLGQCNVDLRMTTGYFWKDVYTYFTWWSLSDRSGVKRTFQTVPTPRTSWRLRTSTWSTLTWSYSRAISLTPPSSSLDQEKRLTYCGSLTTSKTSGMPGQHDDDPYLTLISRSLSPGKYINQFACENVFTCKDLLATTSRRANQSGASSKCGPTSAPPWLPLTFNLLYEIPLFVRHYLERKEK